MAIYSEIIVQLCLSRDNEVALNLLWTYGPTKKNAPPGCCHHTDRNAENKAALVTVPLEQAPSVPVYIQSWALLSNIGHDGSIRFVRNIAKKAT